MDTREKIVDLQRALAAAGAGRRVIVTGYFDPLTAAHARRLRELRAGSDCLIAVVVDPPRPLVQMRARAEMVAALGCVDFVAAGAGGLDFQEAVHEEEADEARRRDLIARVRQRQGALAG